MIQVKDGHEDQRNTAESPVRNSCIHGLCKINSLGNGFSTRVPRQLREDFSINGAGTTGIPHENNEFRPLIHTKYKN